MALQPPNLGRSFLAKPMSNFKLVIMGASFLIPLLVIVGFAQIMGDYYGNLATDIELAKTSVHGGMSDDPEARARAAWAEKELNRRMEAGESAMYNQAKLAQRERNQRIDAAMARDGARRVQGTYQPGDLPVASTSPSGTTTALLLAGGGGLVVFLGVGAGAFYLLREPEGSEPESLPTEASEPEPEDDAPPPEPARGKNPFM